MAASEYEIIRDQQERDNLQRSIASAETALPVSAPSTRRILENLIEGARGRIATLDTKIKDEHEAQVREQAAIALMAQKEAALTAREQAEYSGFLKEDFFTKRDFGRLEHFYVDAWDRLSEEGKDEMSHRFWEGIRHGEYKFSDAPKAVREKEEDLMYTELSNPSKKHESIERIPGSDRADFIRAYRSGNRDEAAKVLNRESFQKNAALETASGVKHQSPMAGNSANDELLLANDKSAQSEARPAGVPAANNLSFEDVKLKGVVLADSSSAPSAAAMPIASGPPVSGRSPV